MARCVPPLWTTELPAGPRAEDVRDHPPGSPPRLNSDETDPSIDPTGHKTARRPLRPSVVSKACHIATTALDCKRALSAREKLPATVRCRLDRRDVNGRPASVQSSRPVT